MSQHLWLGHHSLQWHHNECNGVSNTTLMIVYSTICSFPNQRRHQSSASLAFVRGIHWWPVNSPHKGPVMWKIFPFDDVIILTASTSYKTCSNNLCFSPNDLQWPSKRIWWLCLVLTTTTRFASDLALRKSVLSRCWQDAHRILTMIAPQGAKQGIWGQWLGAVTHEDAGWAVQSQHGLLDWLSGSPSSFCGRQSLSRSFWEGSSCQPVDNLMGCRMPQI